MTVKERLRRIIDELPEELPETATVGELLARAESVFSPPSESERPTAAAIAIGPADEESQRLRSLTRKTPEEVRKGLDELTEFFRSIHKGGPPLSDWAISREAMYEGRE